MHNKGVFFVGPIHSAKRIGKLSVLNAKTPNICYPLAQNGGGGWLRFRREIGSHPAGIDGRQFNSHSFGGVAPDPSPAPVSGITARIPTIDAQAGRSGIRQW